MKTACQRMKYLRKYRDKLVDENGIVDERVVSIAIHPDQRGKEWKGRWCGDEGLIGLAPEEPLFAAARAADRAGKLEEFEPEYTRRFNAQLAKIDPRDVVKILGEDAILVCYCFPGDFCHRRLVAHWLEAVLGIDVIEVEGPRVQVGLDKWRNVCIK